MEGWLWALVGIMAMIIIALLVKIAEKATASMIIINRYTSKFGIPIFQIPSIGIATDAPIIHTNTINNVAVIVVIRLAI